MYQYCNSSIHWDDGGQGQFNREYFLFMKCWMIYYEVTSNDFKNFPLPPKRGKIRHCIT